MSAIFGASVFAAYFVLVASGLIERAYNWVSFKLITWLGEHVEI